MSSACSPDGKWVLYTTAGAAYRIPVEGGRPVQVTPEKPLRVLPSIAPDGQRIAYVYVDGGTNPVRTLTIGRATGGSAERTFTAPADLEGWRGLRTEKRFSIC